FDGQTLSSPFTISIAQIVVPSFSHATVGIPYVANFTIQNGNATFDVDSGSLPPGLFLSANGSVSGTPSTAGTFSFTVIAGGMKATVSITVDNPRPIIQTSVLLDGFIGQVYSQPVNVSGGHLPYTFTASGVPAGLSISSSGTISGVPTQ